MENSLETPSIRATGSKGRSLIFYSPSVADKAKVRIPYTRSSAKQESIVKEDIVEDPIKRKGKVKIVPIEEHIEVIDITTPPENTTFKRLIRQLREAKDEIHKLKREELVERKKLSDLMDMYYGTLVKSKFISKRFRPLHRQLKNLNRQNITYQIQIRVLNMELHPFREELSKRNLDALDQVAIRRSSRLRK
jgi:hypothetical protein